MYVCVLGCLKMHASFNFKFVTCVFKYFIGDSFKFFFLFSNYFKNFIFKYFCLVIPENSSRRPRRYIVSTTQINRNIILTATYKTRRQLVGFVCWRVIWR